MNGLEGDFSFSDAGERKIDRQQGLVPGLQLSDQSPLVEIGAVDFTTAKNECKSSKVLSVEVKKKASIINAVQAFSVIEIRQRIQTLPTPQNSAKSWLENAESQVNISANPVVTNLRSLKSGCGKFTESVLENPRDYGRECDLDCLSVNGGRRWEF